MTADDDRYHRQILLFGEHGQTRLAAIQAAIVGLGGLGAHVAQQLAYLGLRRFTLVDHDVVSSSSLNRLIGAVEADAVRKLVKVAVAERAIGMIQPGAEVTSIRQPVETEEAADAIAGADIAIGCLDDDTGRLRLTELASGLSIPYLDLATDTGAGFYGGRVVFATGTGCLSCLDELDQQRLAQAAMTADQRTAHDRIYGIPRGELDQTGPSVVSLNGVVASLGVTELMAWATSLRPPHPYLNYRGDLGTVNRRIDPPRPDCYYCQRWCRSTSWPAS